MLKYMHDNLNKDRKPLIQCPPDADAALAQIGDVGADGSDGAEGLDLLGVQRKMSLDCMRSAGDASRFVGGWGICWVGSSEASCCAIVRRPIGVIGVCKAVHG